MKSDSPGSLAIASFLIILIILGVFFMPIDDDTPPVEPEPVIPIHLDLQWVGQTATRCLSAIPPKPNLNPEGKLFFEEFTPLLDTVTLPKCDMVMESLGNYWVTNYCPAECGGSWATSSGATCHRSSYEDRLTIPTTCAIDLSVGDYYDLYYLPAFDRVFIAEDTGPGVQGKWLDLFYEDYSDVVNFPVGYYEVYVVEYVYGEVPANQYSIQPYMQQPFIDALEEYNYEPPVSITIIRKNISPWTYCNTLIVNIVRKCWDEEPINVPYI